MAHPDEIEDALREGARKARAVAAPRLEIMRRAVGLGALVAPSGKTKIVKKTGKRARIVSFRDGEGFRFRLVGADGEELLLSRAFDEPRGAGQASRALAAEDAGMRLVPVDASRFAFMQDGATLAASAEFTALTARDAAIERTRAALASLRDGE
jgi:tryptophanyl-tRNA synthetase